MRNKIQTEIILRMTEFEEQKQEMDRAILSSEFRIGTFSLPLTPYHSNSTPSPPYVQKTVKPFLHSSIYVIFKIQILFLSVTHKISNDHKQI